MKVKVLHLFYAVGFADLLIMSEFIKEVALAFTAGSGDLDDAGASKVTSLPPLSPS